jgi:hypothetical protein
MISRLWNRRPNDCVVRERQFKALLEQHRRQVSIIAESGVETAQATYYFPSEYPAHAGYNVHDGNLRLEEFRQCKFHRVFDFLQPRQQIDRAVVHADVRGDSTDARICERQEPMLDGSILYDRISVVNDDEFPPRHANADIEGTRLAVAPRRGKDSHALRVMPAACDAERGPPRNSDTVIGRVVVDEYEFQVRIAA